MIGLLALAAAAAITLRPGGSAVSHLQDGHPVIERADVDAQPPPGSLRATFVWNPAGGAPGAYLFVVNNTADWLDYRALAAFCGMVRPTSVCTVMSGGRLAVEHWPDLLDAITLDDFTKAAEVVRCR